MLGLFCQQKTVTEFTILTWPSQMQPILGLESQIETRVLAQFL